MWYLARTLTILAAAAALSGCTAPDTTPDAASRDGTGQGPAPGGPPEPGEVYNETVPLEPDGIDLPPLELGEGWRTLHIVVWLEVRQVCMTTNAGSSSDGPQVVFHSPSGDSDETLGLPSGNSCQVGQGSTVGHKEATTKAEPGTWKVEADVTGLGGDLHVVATAG